MGGAIMSRPFFINTSNPRKTPLEQDQTARIGGNCQGTYYNQQRHHMAPVKAFKIDKMFIDRVPEKRLT